MSIEGKINSDESLLWATWVLLISFYSRSSYKFPSVLIKLEAI